MTRPSLASAAACTVLGAALTLGTLILMALSGAAVPAFITGSHLVDAALAVVFLAYTGLGGLIVARRSGNRVGWVLLLAGLCLQTWTFTTVYAGYGLLISPGSLPAALAAVWIAEWVVVPGFGLALAVMFLVFPDGRLPSRRWSPVAWLALASIAVTATAWATEPGPTALSEAIDNPLPVNLVPGIDLGGFGWLALLVSVLASASSLVVRYRRATGLVRRQVQWLAYAGILMALGWAGITAVSSGIRVAKPLAEFAFPASLAVIPTAVAIAIVKHQLYDIERVLARTLLVAGLAIVITATYVAVVVGVGHLVGTAGQPNPVLSIVATAVVAVAFQPLRERLQRVANRIVYGPRANPYDVLATFSSQVGTASAFSTALPHMARVLAEGTGATNAEVWLVVGAQLRQMSHWPDYRPPPPPIPMNTRTELPAMPGAAQVVPVHHRGDLLGALAISVLPGRDLSPTERRLLSDLAAQAGLMLRNLQLIEEIKASRQRIVSVQDQERRRIERDIHDGVQQRLVSLALALRMARGEVPDSAVPNLGQALDDAAAEVQRSLNELRELARGIHPSILTEGGLGPALESLAERCPVAATLTGAPARRLPSEVEVTAYFVVSEALANAAKHASASLVKISCELNDDRLRVQISDNGVGGAEPSQGTGLAGLADRVAALDGRLGISSPPGGGTTMVVELPCAQS